VLGDVGQGADGLLGSGTAIRIDSGGRLLSLSVTPHAAEDVLQGLLESHSDLLAAGHMMTPPKPRLCGWKR
jgi:hypothetical protein